MRRAVVWIVVGLLGLVSAPAFAWNGYGHMMVAAAAYKRLTPAVKTKVGALLKVNPNYATWVKGVAPGDQQAVAFVVAATWPDFIKNAPGYVADGTDNGNRPANVPASSQNIGYADKAMHKYWHFIDVPFSADGTKTNPPDFVNAQTQIAVFRAALKSPGTSDDVKSYDLVWLIHLVGDVHQPLHCTSRFDKDQTSGDQGGNLVKLAGEPNELHAFWDDILGTTNEDHAAATAAAAKLKAPTAKLAGVSDEGTWVAESFTDAQSRTYKTPSIKVGAGPFTVNAAYTKQAASLARARVSLAGARLANLLNDALE